MKKTLDEVIDWYENRKGVLTGLATKQEMEDGALYYLKSYSNENRRIETWDELQQMYKKPVWIENVIGNKIYSGWAIVRGVTDLYLMTDERLFYRKDFNGTWKAYRKEPLVQVKDLDKE